MNRLNKLLTHLLLPLLLLISTALPTMAEDFDFTQYTSPVGETITATAPKASGTITFDKKINLSNKTLVLGMGFVFWSSADPQNISNYLSLSFSGSIQNITYEILSPIKSTQIGDAWTTPICYLLIPIKITSEDFSEDDSISALTYSVSTIEIPESNWGVSYEPMIDLYKVSQVYVTEHDYINIYDHIWDPNAGGGSSSISFQDLEKGNYTERNKWNETDDDPTSPDYGKKQLNYDNGTFLYDLGKLASGNYQGRTIYLHYPAGKSITNFNVKWGNSWNNCNTDLGNFTAQETTSGGWNELGIDDYPWLGYFGGGSTVQIPATVLLDGIGTGPDDRYLKITPAGANLGDKELKIYMSDADTELCPYIGEGTASGGDGHSWSDRILWPGQTGTKNVYIDLGGQTSGLMKLGFKKVGANAVTINTYDENNVFKQTITDFSDVSEEKLTSNGYSSVPGYTFIVTGASYIEIVGGTLQSLDLEAGAWSKSPWTGYGEDGNELNTIAVPEGEGLDKFVDRCDSEYLTAPELTSGCITFPLGAKVGSASDKVETYISFYTSKALSASDIKLDGTSIPEDNVYVKLTKHGYETIIKTNLTGQESITLTAPDIILSEDAHLKISRANWDKYPVVGWDNYETPHQNAISDFCKPLCVITSGIDRYYLKDQPIQCSPEITIPIEEFVIGFPLQKAETSSSLTINSINGNSLTSSDYIIACEDATCQIDESHTLHYILFKIKLKSPSSIKSIKFSLADGVGIYSATMFNPNANDKYDWREYINIYLTPDDFKKNNFTYGSDHVDFSDLLNNEIYWNRTIWKGQIENKENESGNAYSLTYNLGKKEPTKEGATYSGKNLYFSYKLDSDERAPEISKIIGVSADGTQTELNIPEYTFSSSTKVDIPVDDKGKYGYCGYYTGEFSPKDFPIVIDLDGDYETIIIESDKEFKDPAFYMTLKDWDAVPPIGWEMHGVPLSLSNGTWYSRIKGEFQKENTDGIDLGGIVNGELSLSYSNPSGEVAVEIYNSNKKLISTITGKDITHFEKLTEEGPITNYSFNFKATNARYIKVNNADFVDVTMKEVDWTDNPWTGWKDHETPGYLFDETENYPSRCTDDYENPVKYYDPTASSTDNPQSANIAYIDLGSPVGTANDPVDTYIFFDIDKPYEYKISSNILADKYNFFVNYGTDDIAGRYIESCQRLEDSGYRVGMKVKVYGYKNLSLRVPADAVISNVDVKMTASDWINAGIDGWNTPWEESKPTEWQGGNYKNYAFEHRRGIMEDASLEYREYQEAVKHYNKDNGKWYDQENITALSEAGIKIPDCSWLTSADDPRIGDGLKYQRTHTVEHDIYLLPGQTAMLHPYYQLHSYQYCEGAIRWYDFNTDRTGNGGNTYLSFPTYDRSNVIKTKYGYFSGHALKPDVTDGSHPTEHGDNHEEYKIDRGVYASFTWKGEKDLPGDMCIAADLYSLWQSNHDTKDLFLQYVDNMFWSEDPETDLSKKKGTIIEPVISVRHLFNIHDARKFADRISSSEQANKEYIASTRRVICAPVSVANDLHIRLDYPQPHENNGNDYNQKSQYFYKTSSGEYKQVERFKYFTYKVEDGIINSIPLATGGFEGYDIGDNSKLIMTQNNSHQNPSEIEGESYFYRAIKASGLEEGTYIVKGYGSDKNGNLLKTADGADLQLMEFEVTLLNASESSIALHNAIPERHRPDELNQKIGDPIDKIDFEGYKTFEEDKYWSKTLVGEDYGKEEWNKYEYNNLYLTGNATNTKGPKLHSRWPLPWDECNYMFGYNENGNWNQYYIQNSIDEGTFQQWVNGKVSKDGHDAGYCLYVNAAADPGYLAKLNINDLCMGTTFHVSAWFADLSGSTDVADLAFNFIAETKDDEEIILHTFQTGPIPSATSWYHIYYEFMPDLRGYDESKVRKYYIRIDNNSVGSKGADYCIDDIRLYAAKPEVDAYQVRPLCDGEESTDMRIQTPFRAFLGSVGQQASTDKSNKSAIDVYYSFVDADEYESMIRNGSTAEEAYEKSVLRYNYMKEEGDVKTTYGVISVPLCYANLDKYSGGTADGDYEVNTAYRPSEGNGDNLLLFFTKPSIEGGMQVGKRYSILIFSPLAEDLEAGVEITPEYINDSFYEYDYFGNCTKTASFYVQGSGAVKIDGLYETPSNSVSSCSTNFPVINVNIAGFEDGLDIDKNNTALNTLKDNLKNNVPIDWLYLESSLYVTDEQNAELKEDITSLKGAIAALRSLSRFDTYFDEIKEEVDIKDPDTGNVTGKEEKTVGYKFNWSKVDFNDINLTDNDKVILTNYKDFLIINKIACPFNTAEYLKDSDGHLSKNYILYAFPDEKTAIRFIDDSNLFNTTTSEENTDSETENASEKLYHIICLNPIRMELLFSGAEPKLYHGLKNIQYPSGLGDDVPVRIGSEQIVAATAATDKEEDVKKTVPLWVPIRKIETVSAGATGVQKRSIDYSTKWQKETITRNFGSEIMLVDTDDPTYLNADGTLKLDMTERSGATKEDLYQDAEKDDNNELVDHCIAFLTKLTADNESSTNFAEVVFRRGFHFNEGYWYRLRYQFEEDFDASDETSHTACAGHATFTLKIVPTFQKWNPRDNGNNWNDDKHWNRVYTAELRTTVGNLEDYPAAKTIYEPNGVFIDGIKTIDGKETFINKNEYSFVPMYFTKVLVPAYENADLATYATTLPATKSYPVLIAEKNKAVDIYLHNGANEFTKYKMNFMETLNGEKVTKEVDLPINYEMDALPYERGDGGIDCGPFQPNTCDEIHFNAGAELKGQQYLDYNKAWLDFEIKPDVWSLMSSPLQRTFAGDMYTVRNGCRQTTPLFVDINFIPYAKEGYNDRFGPAVYQRSWDRSNAWVYQMNSNGSWTELDKHEQYEYAAGNHNSTSSPKDVAWVANWSRVYNDVNEGYSIDYSSGFSIKPTAEKDKMTAGVKTMSFRLPKADTFYDYYSKDFSARGDHTAIVRGEWSNKSEVGKNPTYKNFEVRGEKITVSKSHRLNDMKKGSDGYSGTLRSNSNGSTPYFLVGNPFMCSMDMAKFFERNSHLIEPKYWTLDKEGQSVTGFLSKDGWLEESGVIQPMTGFFVKAYGNRSDLELVFTDEMQVLAQGLSEKDPSPSPTRGSSSDPAAFTITTAGSRVTVLIDPEATADFDPSEDAEALLDMDCGEAPAVFTLASGIATSIDSRPEAEGLTLALNNGQKDTEIRFAGRYLDEAALDIMDLVSGERSPLTDGTVYRVADPGHRLMIVGAEAPELPAEVISIRRSGQYEVTVAAPADQGEMEIVVTDMTGKVLRTVKTTEASWTLPLPKGLYLITARTAHARRSASLIL